MLLLTLLSLGLVTWLLFNAAKRLRRTTLSGTAAWALIASTCWLVAAIGSNASLISQAVSDVLFYLTSILLLCPGISVLGARRPGNTAWNFFVLLPLIAVLLWPAIASTRFLNSDTPLELESPPLIGFALVLIMGAGNYFGTRFTLPVLLYAASVTLLAASMAESAPSPVPERTTARHLAAVLMAASIGMASLRAGERYEVSTTLDRVWLSFVDTFGLVWAKRVMDRLNEAGTHEKWPAVIHWHGIEWNPDAGEEQRRQAEEKLDAKMRWLLKRFVDPDWIDERLKDKA